MVRGLDARVVLVASPTRVSARGSSGSPCRSLVEFADGSNAGYTADELRDAGQVEAAVAAALGAGKRKQPEAPSTTPAPKKPRATPREDASTVMAVAPAVPIDVDAPPPTSRDKPIIIDDD